MIHDAIVPVTCDNYGCGKYFRLIDCFFVSRDNPLDYLKDSGWIIIDGKHYCSEGCAREAIGLEFLHGMCGDSNES